MLPWVKTTSLEVKAKECQRWICSKMLLFPLLLMRGGSVRGTGAARNEESEGSGSIKIPAASELKNIYVGRRPKKSN
jgi:hypothetical protein